MPDTGKGLSLTARGQKAWRVVEPSEGQLDPPCDAICKSVLKGTALPRTRMIVIVTGLLWLAHAGVIAILGTKAPGPIVSDLIQLTLGAVLIHSILAASRRAIGRPVRSSLRRHL